MKRILVAMLVFPAIGAAIAVGCSGKPQGSGVMCAELVDGGGCFFPATVAPARTQCGDVTEYCDTTGVTAPSLDCLGKTGPAPGAAAPTMVTLTGFVHVFSSGPDSNNVKVEVFDAAQVTQADPANQQPLGTTTATLDPTTQRACDADGAKGCSIPLANGCALPVCNDGLGGRQDDQKYCRDNGSGPTGGECSDRLRWESRYAISGVPTNTRLVVRVTGPGNKSDSTWATTVSFNVFLSTNDRACKSLSDTDCLDLSDAANPKYQLNASALSAADYVNIPVIAGLSGGITSGEGAVAGEVHDCDNVRVANVEVTTTPTADRFTYFNGNPIKTLPDVSRAAVGTDRLGLFSALNVKPGPVFVETAGGDPNADGGLTSFGTFSAFVYAGSVSIINVNGGKGTR
ncbi:MAG TPA: hypothetical protein VN947_09605 [Polyangia bacterium]|nr:hypothetical protein [Polyangia bacterium]